MTTSLVTGSGCVGVVKAVDVTKGAEDFYFVDTVKEERGVTDQTYTPSMPKKLKGVGAHVEWAKPRNRRHQRLFGWGDVVSTRADVTKACKNGDTRELNAIFPQAQELIEDSELGILPMV